MCAVVSRDMRDRGPSRFKVITVLALAFALRFAFAFQSPDEAFLEIDGEDYRDISQNLAAGRGFAASTYRWYEPEPESSPPNTSGASSEIHPDLYRPAVVPLLGAGLYFLPGSWGVWARLVSVALGTVSVWLLYAIARRMFEPRVAFWAMALFAVHPFAIFYAARWSTETPFLCALLVYLLALTSGAPDTMSERAKPRGSGAPHASRGGAIVHAAMWTGAALGLAILTRPTAIVLLPLSLLWYWMCCRDSFWKVSGASLLVSCLVIGPWAARNFAHTGVPTPLTFVGPYNVWLGTNEWQHLVYEADSADELGRAINGLYMEGAKGHVRTLEAAGTIDAVEVNRYWLAQSLDYVKREPRKFAFILARRALHYFQPAPQKGAVSESMRWVSIGWMSLLYVAAIAGLVRARKIKSQRSSVLQGWSLWILPLAGFVTSMPFIFSLRYRFPFFDPMVVLLAASAIPTALDRFRGRLGGVHADRLAGRR